MSEPTITIAGVVYVEARPGTTAERNNCMGCAFRAEDDRRCGMALSRTPKEFGGDCVERDVVYVPKEPA